MLTPHKACDIDPTALTSCPKIPRKKRHLNIFEPKRLTARSAHTSSPQWLCGARRARGWQRAAASQVRSTLTELEKTWRVTEKWLNERSTCCTWRLHVWLIERFQPQRDTYPGTNMVTFHHGSREISRMWMAVTLNIYFSEMVHFSILNGFCLPLLSFFFSLRSVCPPTQQMAKVKHMSVLWKWRRCQSSTLFYPTSLTSAMLWHHLQVLQM